MVNGEAGEVRQDLEAVGLLQPRRDLHQVLLQGGDQHTKYLTQGDAVARGDAVAQGDMVAQGDVVAHGDVVSQEDVVA